MNTIDATPQLSLGDDVTLFSRHYRLVNLPVRTTTRGPEKAAQCDLW